MSEVLKPKFGKRGKRSGPTYKQEAFVQAYLYGPDHIRGNQSAAYREAYNTVNSTPESIWVNSCKIMYNANVAQRLNQERAKMAEQNSVTAADIVAELDETLKLAQGKEQLGAAVSASMGKAKLLGFITEKVQQDTTIRDHRDAKPAQFSSALDRAKAS